MMSGLEVHSDAADEAVLITTVKVSVQGDTLRFSVSYNHQLISDHALTSTLMASFTNVYSC